MIEILIFVELVVILVLGISLALFISSYQKVLRDFYLLRHQRLEKGLKRRKIDKVDQIFEEKIKKEIEEAGDAAKDEVREAARKVSGEVSQKALEEVGEFKKGLESAIAQEFDSAKAEIKAYKDQKLTEVAKIANGIVSQVVREVLGKAINAEDQEKLVLKALEDAKRQNLL